MKSSCPSTTQGPSARAWMRAASVVLPALDVPLSITMRPAATFQSAMSSRFVVPQTATLEVVPNLG